MGPNRAAWIGRRVRAPGTNELSGRDDDDEDDGGLLYSPRAARRPGFRPE
jgi:hypothetical protein